MKSVLKPLKVASLHCVNIQALSKSLGDSLMYKGIKAVIHIWGACLAAFTKCTPPVSVPLKWPLTQYKVTHSDHTEMQHSSLNYLPARLKRSHMNAPIWICGTLSSCTVPAGASTWSKTCTKGKPVCDLPGRNPPQQTGPEASLQPARLTYQNSERNTEQKMSAALRRLVGELKRLVEHHRFFALTETSVTSCATSLSHRLCLFCILTLPTPVCHTCDTVSEMSKNFHKLFWKFWIKHTDTPAGRWLPT